MRAKARKRQINQIDDTHFEISVPEVPQRGKANTAVLKLLAEHLSTPLSSLSITSGSTCARKVVRIS